MVQETTGESRSFLGVSDKLVARRWSVLRNSLMEEAVFVMPSAAHDDIPSAHTAISETVDRHEDQVTQDGQRSETFG